MASTIRIHVNSPPRLAAWQARCLTLLSAERGVQIVGDDADELLDLTGTMIEGAWQYRFDGDPDWRSALRRQVLSGQSVCTSSLVRLPDEVLYSSVSHVHPWSVSAHAERHLAKTATFAARVAHDLREGVSARMLASAPRSADHARHLKLALRALGERTGYRRQWFLAVHRTDGPMPRSFEGFQPIFPPADRFWADPFPVQQGDGYLIFFEDYSYASGKGVISVITSRGGGWSAATPVLETESHLSYPHVFHWRNDWWMIPETGARRAIELYRADPFPERWRLETVLLNELHAADATLTLHRGTWWMFATVAEPGASLDEELHLFSADSPLGPWVPHPRNPVVSDVRSARPAGALFEDGGILYRPAQDCGRRYGWGIVIHRVERLDSEGYEETAVARIPPTWRAGLRGTHTLNRAGGLVVVDGLRSSPHPSHHSRG